MSHPPNDDEVHGAVCAVCSCIPCYVFPGYGVLLMSFVLSRHVVFLKNLFSVCLLVVQLFSVFDSVSRFFRFFMFLVCC